MSDVLNLDQVQAKGYTFISAGTAYNLTLDFYPDFVEIYNYTQSATAAKIVKSTWFNGFPAGDAISVQSIADDGATSNLNSVIETTNGFTWAGTEAGFTDQHLAISGATAASPVVVTSATHGLVDGDRVVITDVVGMTELNNRIFQVDVLSTTTFALQDFKGNSIDGAAYTAYSSGGQATKMDESVAITNANPTYVLTLGTGVVGANSDVMFVHAVKYPSGIKDLGDVA